MSALILHGSLIGTSAQDALNGGNACADPAILENALGVTWDALDLCLAYGLSADDAKGLFGVGSALENVHKALGKNAVSGGNGGREHGIGDTASRDGGALSEVGDRLVVQDAAENVVDLPMNGVAVGFIGFIRQAIRRLKFQAFKLDAVEQPRKPRPLSPLSGEFEQDHVRGQFKASDTGVLRRVGIVGHRASPSVSVNREAIQPRDWDSGKAAQ